MPGYCRLCGKPTGTGDGVHFTKEHIVKESIQKELGIQNEPITRIEHSPVTGEIDWRGTVPARRHVQSHICNACNNHDFKRVDDPAEDTIIRIARGQMGFDELTGEIATNLAWWALKVAVVQSCRSDDEISNVPPYVAEALIARLKRREGAEWPGGVAFVAKSPTLSRVGTCACGSPPFYQPEDYVTGTFYCSVVLLDDVMIGYAYASNPLLWITFVEGVHVPFFSETTMFKHIPSPRLPTFVDRIGPSGLNAVCCSVGLAGIRRPEPVAVEYVMPDGTSAITPSCFEPTSPEWMKRFDKVKQRNAECRWPVLESIVPFVEGGLDPDFEETVQDALGGEAVRFLKGEQDVRPPF